MDGRTIINIAAGVVLGVALLAVVGALLRKA
jgi:hypothetical protein